MSVENIDFFQSSLELSKLIKDKLKSGDITFDGGGHFLGKKILPYDPMSVFDFTRGDLYCPENISILTEAINNNVALDTYLKFSKSYSYKCNECSEEIQLECNGKHMRCCNLCKYPEGMPAYEIFLNVPSGKMVVANDLRKFFPIVGDYEIECVEGCKKTTEKYAEVGMAHAFVGNTCPDMYKVKDGEFVIGISTERKRPVKGCRHVASICTDLWWFSIVDYDQFVVRSGREPGKYEEVVDVKPGVYRFRHRYHQVDQDDYRNPQIYTYVDWVRKPDDVVDFQAQYMTQNFTAGQIICSMLNSDYKDLYLEDIHGKKKSKIDSIMSAANQLMCVIGNGSEYHPSGWVGFDSDLKMDTPDMDIPIFTKSYSWYPWSTYSNISNFAERDIYMNPSFLALACNICQSIVRYGAKSVYDKTDVEYAKKDAKNSRNCALASLKKFASKYPEHFPEYCRDLLKLKNEE